MDWTADLAYVVGLITTDGCLSKDGRHIDLTSKDLEQIQTFRRILKLETNIIGLKTSGSSNNIYYRIQFSHVMLYRFLLDLGLTPAKSKTLGLLKIPDEYFTDFLRGHLDGDGSINSYYDPRWKNSFMLYTTFVSASEKHITWIKDQIYSLYKVEGRLSFHKNNRLHIKSDGIYQLRYAKYASVELLNKIYYKNDLACLKRKRFKIDLALGIISEQAEMEKLVNSQP